MDEHVDNDIIHHLLFHKSLLDNENPSSIDSYITLLDKTYKGEYISIDNPIDRSIALTFELVMQQHLDPWDIDLVNFSTMYLKRAQEEKIDLITAGRIILMAWRILRLQSDDLINNIYEKQDDAQEELFPTEMYLTSDDPYSYTNLLMNLPDPPLEEPIRRETTRKVTLIELLNAFDQARIETERYQKMEENRRIEYNKLIRESHRRMIGTTHEDNLEEDIEEIWQRIKDSKKTMISLQELCNIKDKDEVIKTFLSLLFLAYNNRIRLFQRHFPYGKIYVKPLGYT